MPAGNLGRALLVAAAVFAIDRVLKIWVVEVMDLRQRLFIPVVDPWLNLTMAWNEGINFGLFDFGAAGRWVLVALAIAIVGGASPLGAQRRLGAGGRGRRHRRGRARQRLGPGALGSGGGFHQHELLRLAQSLRLQRRGRGDLRRRGLARAGGIAQKAVTKDVTEGAECARDAA